MYGSFELKERVGIGIPVRVEYREVGEDSTSKLFSLGCHKQLEPMLNASRRPIHTVRRCLATSCVRLLWHRDVNVCVYVCMYVRV